jgi:hypothetical protein
MAVFCFLCPREIQNCWVEWTKKEKNTYSRHTITIGVVVVVGGTTTQAREVQHPKFDMERVWERNLPRTERVDRVLYLGAACKARVRVNCLSQQPP